MKTEIFHTDLRVQIEKTTKDYLNLQKDFLSANSVDDPRSVGGAIQHLIEKGFSELLGEYCTKYICDFSRKAMEDIAFNDKQGNYVAVDVKTHREDTDFNMPNLTSVEKLARFYDTNTNYLSLLLVSYVIKDSETNVTKVLFVPIEFLSWSCLTLGALGWGQIQVKNSNTIVLDLNATRKAWMVEMCNKLKKFYGKEVEKILKKRVGYFDAILKSWEERDQ